MNCWIIEFSITFLCTVNHITAVQPAHQNWFSKKPTNHTLNGCFRITCYYTQAETQVDTGSILTSDAISHTSKHESSTSHLLNILKSTKEAWMANDTEDVKKMNTNYKNFQTAPIYCILFVCTLTSWVHGSTVVKVLCYKSKGRWFDPSWCQWIFHWHKILPIALWPWDRLSL